MNEINQINNEPVRKSRILLVDDEPGLRTAVKTFLEDEGFEIFIAVDGEDGWEKAQTIFPDLIISDIMMPRANGYALLEKIREDEKLGGTPVIFLTAKGMTLDRTEGYLAGVDDYISKPFDPDELAARVKNVINRQERLLKEAVRRAKEDLLKRLEDENRYETEDFIANTSRIIGLGAVKYADLSQNRITNYQFSFDRMLSLNGNTAPYLLYTLVRISGIKRKNDFVYDSKDFQYINYEHKSEWKLIRKLLRFDEVIISIEKDLMPNRLCNYLFELCQTFNRFYDQVPILKEEKYIKISRLNLCDLTAKTLKLSLELLGIETLERM